MITILPIRLNGVGFLLWSTYMCGATIERRESFLLDVVQISDHMQSEHIKLVTFWVAKKAQSFLTHPPSPYTHVRDPPHTLYSIPPLSYFLRCFPWAYIFITDGLVQSQFDLEEKLLRSSSHNKIPKPFSSVCWLAQIVTQLQVEAQDIHRWAHRGKRKEACVDVNWNVVKLVPSTRTVVTLLRHEKVFQTPIVPACNSKFYFCQLTCKATRRPPYSHWSNG